MICKLTYINIETPVAFIIVLFRKFPGGYEKTHVSIHIGDQHPDQDLNLGIPVYEPCAAVERL